jgi:anti-anti-sigma factor
MSDFNSPLSIALERQDDVCILTLMGRFASGANPEQLRSYSDQVKNQGLTKVLVDLRDLSSIGSTGMGFLAGLYTSIVKLPGGKFVLVGSNQRVREAFELTRLDTILPMAANVATGLAALNGDAPLVRSAREG